MAFDLVDEFRKANVQSGQVIQANYETDPRQVLRQASTVYAPLGNSMLIAANQAGLRLDEYFSEVESYNISATGGATDISDIRGRYNSVQSLRAIVGGDLDLANGQIPVELRWKYSDGKEYVFRTLCAKPPTMRTGGAQADTSSV
jgi:hypothetical protein